MNTKAIAASIRKSLKDAGITAKVRMTPGCSQSVQVNVPTFEARFTDAEQRTIRETAIALGLTHVRGLEIHPELPTMGMGDTYYLPA